MDQEKIPEILDRALSPNQDEQNKFDGTQKLKRGDYNSQFITHVFITVFVTMSPWISFCWRQIALSFYLTYQYLVWFYYKVDKFGHTPYWPFHIPTLLHAAVLVISILWCLSITPIHVLAPTLMDLWTPYAIRPIFKASEVVYDAGESAAVE